MSQMWRVNEIFYSIKGEGLWSGQPMHFLRLAHCNLTCDHCDTPFNAPVTEKTFEEIVEEFVKVSPSGQINITNITGGEPALQDLQTLITLLNQRRGIKVHLETNGTLPLPLWLKEYTGNFVCISPKLQFGEPLEENLRLADEIKMPVAVASDIVRADLWRDKVKDKVPEWCTWWLHPWNDRFEFKRIGYIDDVAAQRFIWSHPTCQGINPFAQDLCRDRAMGSNGEWRVSIQLHKILRVR